MNPPARTMNILDIAAILVRWRWKIFRHTFVAALVVALVSLVLPQRFTAVTTLMPPQEQGQSALEGVLGEVTIPGLPLPTSSSSSELLVEILKSRSVGERVLARQFRLKDKSDSLYKLLKYPSIDVGLLKIKSRRSFSYLPNGVISISVQLGDRQLAADVANAYVDALDEVNQEKSVSRAKNSRLYIESQLRETEQKLNEATKRLAEFQQAHKAVSLEAQMSAAIEQAGMLKGQIIAKEVELGVMLKTMKEGNPLVERTRMELNELNKRYRELQFGNGQDLNAASEFYVPFADVPEVGLQLAEITREVKVQETVWQLLNQQYYQAKIKEAQDTPTVQVLDRAKPPIVRSFPKRKLLVIIFALIAFIVSVFWAFLKEYANSLDEKPEDKKRVEYIQTQLKSDASYIRNRIKRNKS